MADLSKFKPPSVQALVVLDAETTGIPSNERPWDFSTVHFLEVCAYVVDFDLDPLAGYTGVIKPTPEIVAALKANPDVADLHRTNGLLKAMKEDTVTLAQMEQDLIQMLKTKTTFGKGEFAIAGSGVATFDFMLIKRHMPEFASWLAYFPYDFGVFRRVSSLYARGAFYNPVRTSYGDAKVHRAQADVQAHLEEARRQSESTRLFMQYLGREEEINAWLAANPKETP